MPILTEQDIQNLENYAVAVKRIAHEFYDENFQPRTEAKKEHSPSFWDLEWMDDLPELYSNFIDDREVVTALKENGYKQFSKLHVSSSTAYVGLLVDEKDDWSFMRIWNKYSYESQQGRSDNPFVLQPMKTLPMKKGFPVEILLYAPIIDIEPKKFGGRASFHEALAVEDVLKKQFKSTDIRIEMGAGLNDMAVLPNGQIVFADPGHCHHNAATTTDRMLQEQFLSFQEQLNDHPDVRVLFDYMDLTTGEWSQNKFSKNQLKK